MWKKSGILCCRFLNKKNKVLNINKNVIVRTNVTTSENSNSSLPINITAVIYEKIRSEADIVICGGGVMGAAVAYHLALAGFGEQTVVIESCR
jgi:glutamyl-tRNA reductase